MSSPEIVNDVGDPRMTASLRELGIKLANHCHGRDLDRQTIRECEEIAADHRTRAKLEDGLDFPELVVVALDQIKKIHLARRDLGQMQIDNLAVDLVTMYRGEGIAADEVARAIRRAYPHHRPPTHRVGTPGRKN